MSSEQSKELVRRFLEDFTAGRMEKVMAAISESGTWWVAGSFPLSGTRDKKGIAELLAAVGEACKGPIRLEAKAWTAEGDRVAVEVESFAELKNGRCYNNQYHFLFEVRGGKIEGIKEYLDTMHTNAVFCEP
ncbi:MAG: nuclear transport factor 2 family protein [Candidatus Binatia bacterium]